MPAYLRALAVECATDGCHLNALFEVFDTWNGTKGKHCRRHARALVDRMNDDYRVLDADPHL